MKRFLLITILVLIATSLSFAAANLNVQTYFDYTLTYNTNNNLDSLNDFKLNWCAIGVSGDITKDFKGNFLVDFTGNSPLLVSPFLVAGLWYANFVWNVFPGSFLTAGLQDSLFGFTVPSDVFGRNVDLGVTWSQNLGDIFGYYIQLIKGNISVKDGWFDADTVFLGYNLSAITSGLPTAQLMMTLAPVKGLTFGGAARFSKFDYFDTMLSTNITNLAIGLEGFASVGNDLVPGLNLTLDYVTMMNYIDITNSVTNASSYYFAADVSYAIGPVTPGVRYWIKDSDITPGMTNDIDQFIAVYAKINLSADGLVKLVPYFEYKLMENGLNTPQYPFFIRLRFDYQFDLPLVKDPEEKK